MHTIRYATLITLLFLVSFPHLETFKFSIASEEDGVTCIQREREALSAFKQGLTDPSGRLSSWTGNDCCQWSGIQCNDTSGNVVKLDLRNPFPSTSSEIASMEQGDNTAYERSCLGGELKSSLLELKYLEYLDLSLNDFESIQIPRFIGMLQNLKLLNLSSASFAGEIPPHLGNLSNLNYLDVNTYPYAPFRSNKLRSVSLKWISRLSSLRHLNLGKVDLYNVEKDWMQAINMLPSLVELHLPWCYLQNLPISLAFVNLTSLSVLDISQNYFNSSIPNWLFNLTSLRTLDLSKNSFRGTIPRDIVKLISLEVLDLSSNLEIEGQIPRYLGNLCKLLSLSLSGNNFSGKIDELFSGFMDCPNNSLVSLDLSRNQLGGELPNTLGVLKKLQQLDLSLNYFWGSIPPSIGSLSSLQGLDLAANEMNGTIPESFGGLSELTDLYLQRNPWECVVTEVHLMNLTRLELVIIVLEEENTSFVFNVTYEWVPSFRLKFLDLENCLVGPRFPQWLQVQSELTSVTLKNVGIEDTIPEKWFSKISAQLTSLVLSNNQIKGKLPNKLRSPKIDRIDLSYNRFEGPLPLWSTNTPTFNLQSNLFFGPIPANIDELMPQLKYLLLSENRLNGTIPSSMCTMKELVVLSIRTNQLSGELPKCWNESQPLSVVDLANNDITGIIPSSMGVLTSLLMLLLSNNDLEGEIPSLLQNCSRLVSIDLGRNRLSGNLPMWIGKTVTALWMVRLRSNSFSGNIPRHWCNLPILHILDIAENNVSGVIPTCIGNLTSLVYGDSNSMSDQHSFFHIVYEKEAILVTKGRELVYNKTLEYVNIIDLSGNKLTGEIPEDITSLTNLGTLNLSRNHLTGSIPEKIGDFRWLETLDLSHNNLSGPIPQNISSLTFLSHLNLSENNLSGRIPSGNQLQTLPDPSIYGGNPLLCGGPLLTKCLGDEDTSNSPPTSEGLKDDDTGRKDDEMLWFLVSMGSGFVVGLCGVCYTLRIKDSWRKVLFRFVGIA